MGLLSSKIRQEQLQPGDHIYTWRRGYSYSHHGIYIGDGKVIHLIRAPGLIINTSSPSADPSGKDAVVCCSIEEFLSGGELYLYEYGVRRAPALVKRGGTYSLAPSDPPKHVLHRVSVLQEKGFGDYDLFLNNCEDFAVYCKTALLPVDLSRVGSSSSGQINFLYGIGGAALITPYHMLPISSALLFSVFYAIIIFGALMGLKDFKKVEVEKIEVFQRSRKRMGRQPFTGWSQKAAAYIINAAMVFRYWSWTPTSRIFLWIKLVALYITFVSFVDAHLGINQHWEKFIKNQHWEKQNEEMAYMIWLLGYWYWSSTSEDTIFLWTKLFLLCNFLDKFISDGQGAFKLEDYIFYTVHGHAFWYWTPKSRILLWIKLGFFYRALYAFCKRHPRTTNHSSKLGRFFFACLMIQSAVLFRSTGS